MSSISGSLITRNYNSFLGVDFSSRKDEISLKRSPDAINVWKNYKSTAGRCIETRPGLELYKEFDNKIYGIFQYDINKQTHLIVHSGTKLYDLYNQNATLIYEGLNPSESFSFIYSNIFFLKDGINYIEYDGETCSQVVGYIPRTKISMSATGNGTTLEDVNLLSDFRYN